MSFKESPRCDFSTTADSSQAQTASRLSRLLLGAALIGLNIANADAQTDAQRIADLERKLQKALKVIDKLSDKVDQLETGKPQTARVSTTDIQTAPNPASSGMAVAMPAEPASSQTPVNQTVAEQNTKIEALQTQVTQLSSAASNRIIPFDWLHGFADVGGGYGSSGHPSGFGVGSLDLYLTPKLGGQVRSLVELVFEYDRTGVLGTDLERTQIGYAFNDQATVWMGRFHTPYGYWQTAYHHGQQIQPSLLRPRFIDFEDKGGVLPAHTTGVWATGGFQMDGGKFIYDAYAGNTPRIIPDSAQGNGNLGILDPNVAGFSNSSLTAGGKLAYNFTSGALDGLTLGLHGLRSQVQINNNFTNMPTGPANAYVNMNMAGGYLYYNNYDWEVISEVYGFLNHDTTGGTGNHDSWAGFIHVGRQMEQWMPYARLEKLDSNKNDPYFAAQAYGYAYTREAMGLRYDVNTQSALKLEFNYTQPATYSNLANFWESRVQYAIRF